MGLSWSEIAVILLVVLLLFGSKRIPELARALGKASYEFKKAKQSILEESEDLLRDAEKSAAAEDAAAEKKNEKEFKYDVIQGFYFSKAVPSDEFDKFFSKEFK